MAKELTLDTISRLCQGGKFKTGQIWPELSNNTDQHLLRLYLGSRFFLMVAHTSPVSMHLLRVKQSLALTSKTLIFQDRSPAKHGAEIFGSGEICCEIRASKDHASSNEGAF